MTIILNEIELFVLSSIVLKVLKVKSGCRRQSLSTNCAESAEILCDTCHSGILFTFTCNFSLIFICNLGKIRLQKAEPVHKMC